MNLLDVKNLHLNFNTEHQQTLSALRNVSFHLNMGETLGIVGESGSGKSLTNLAIMGLLPDNAKVIADQLTFEGRDLLSMNEAQKNQIRGKKINMIFQDPMSSLHPYLTIETQLTETMLAHLDISAKDASLHAIELLEKVGIKDPLKKLKTYPFELSGGMAQRVMIAMAISTQPKLLIADEPTTALDVTIQKQILDLLKELQTKNNMALMLVSHDLGLIAEYSERIQVMYAGEIVEARSKQDMLNKALHPYTEGLLKSRPTLYSDKSKAELYSISGIVPTLSNRPQGCQFAPRCHLKKDHCEKTSFAQAMHNKLSREQDIDKIAGHVFCLERTLRNEV